MKPIKNKVFCIGCHHHKMVFESKHKADNFIKFNSEEIALETGKAPSRSYYCTFCCAWHLTSITDQDMAIEKDKRDEQLWKKIKRYNSIRIKKASTTNTPQPQPAESGIVTTPIQKRKRIPYTNEGCILIALVEQIKLLIQKLNIRIHTPDLQIISSCTDKLNLLTYELKTKSIEFGIDVKELDKLYDKIAKLHDTYALILLYADNHTKRKEYLDSLSEEEKKLPKNISINNYEIAHTIDTIINDIEHKIDDTANTDNIKSLCKHIKDNLIPQFHQASKKFKNRYLEKLEEISDRLDKNKKTNDYYYKELMISVIELLEKAYQAFYANDFDTCKATLATAQFLMPTPESEFELKVYDQFIKLKNLLNET